LVSGDLHCRCSIPRGTSARDVSTYVPLPGVLEKSSIPKGDLTIPTDAASDSKPNVPAGDVAAPAAPAPAGDAVQRPKRSMGDLFKKMN
jgi:hypothetical protein